MRYWWYAAMSMALLALAGCGWHLRGAHDLPGAMSTTYIETASQINPLVRYVKRDLEAAGIEVVDYPVEDTAILDIRPRSGRRTLSVGPDGKAREYEVFYTVRFSVRKPGSPFRVSSQEITLTRDFIFDPLDAVAVSEEQALIEQSMERDLARLVIERLAATGPEGDGLHETGREEDSGETDPRSYENREAVEEPASTNVQSVEGASVP